MWQPEPVDLDLAQVRAFVAVADRGTFAQAARSLHITQQGLSKRIARLEEQLGTLVDRRRDRVELTAAGRGFLPAARQLVEVADRAVADVRSAPAPPLRIDVWGELHTPAQVIRTLARQEPDLLVELSMRRDLGVAVDAVARHEIDLAFGNAAALAQALTPAGLSSELLLADTIAAMVNARGALAERTAVTPADLARHGIWWPAAGSSAELRTFAEDYASSIGATLAANGSNVGLDALVEQVAADPARIAPVVSTWPLAAYPGIRVIPIRPAVRYPWYAVWRTADRHRGLERVLQAVRAAGRATLHDGDTAEDG